MIKDYFQQVVRFKMNLKIFWPLVITSLYDTLMGVLNCKKYLNTCLFSVKLPNNRIKSPEHIIVRLTASTYSVDKVGVHYSYPCSLFIYLPNHFLVIVILEIHGHDVYFRYGLTITHQNTLKLIMIPCEKYILFVHAGIILKGLC